MFACTPDELARRSNVAEMSTYEQDRKVDAFLRGTSLGREVLESELDWKSQNLWNDDGERNGTLVRNGKKTMIWEGTYGSIFKGSNPKSPTGQNLDTVIARRDVTGIFLDTVNGAGNSVANFRFQGFLRCLRVRRTSKKPFFSTVF